MLMHLDACLVDIGGGHGSILCCVRVQRQPRGIGEGERGKEGICGPKEKPVPQVAPLLGVVKGH